MKGKIIKFNQEKLIGFIMGENAKKYFFHASDVNRPLDISVSKLLTFKADSNKKGLCAKNIILEKEKKYNIKEQKRQKRKLVQINNFTVDINDIKDIHMKGNWEEARLLIKTYSKGTIVSRYFTQYDFQGYDESDADIQAKNDFEILMEQIN